MQIVIDTAHDNPEQIRRAARFLYVLAGPAADAPDPKGTETPDGATQRINKNVSVTFETTPSVPEPSRAYVPPPPPVGMVPPPPNVVDLTGAPYAVPPPPAPSPYAGQIHENSLARLSAEQIASRVAATEVASRGDYPVDSAGMPWDARIHQEKKTKKKDGTWKIKKGLDQKILQAVVAEIATRGPASIVPPAPAMVPLPPGATVSLSAVPMPVAPTVLPTPIHTGPVPAPPTLSAGDVFAYRALMDKISDATITGKLDPGVVHNIVQRHGVPNLQALYARPDLIPDVNTSINLALSGFHS